MKEKENPRAESTESTSPVRWELAVCPNHGAQTCGCYRCNDWKIVEVVSRSAADALADALEKAWAEAHKNHRAINRRDGVCRMDPCPEIRGVVAAYRAGGNTNVGPARAVDPDFPTFSEDFND